ncbi:MAG: SLBB domain-containing protein [Fimbriimonadaceae bacterium]
MRLLAALFLACAAVALAVAQTSVPAGSAEPRHLDDNIRPGTLLLIETVAHPSLSGRFRVDNLGTLQLPFLEPFVAAGLHLDALRGVLSAKVEERFGVVDPDLKVRFASDRQAAVRITGAVRRSLEAPFTPGLNLTQLLALAGPVEQADLGNVRIRTAAGEWLVVSAAKTGVASPELRPGDWVVVVHHSAPREVAVVGAVVRPGTVPYIPGMSLSDAVAAVGGFTSSADRTRVQIERSRQIADTVNRDLGYDAELRPGDVVRVPQVAARTFVQVTGAVARPGRVEMRPGLTLRAAVEYVGGLTVSADAERVVVVRREGPNLRRTRHNLERIRQGRDPDVVLQSDDLIEVPARSPVRPATVPLLSAVGGVRP